MNKNIKIIIGVITAIAIVFGLYILFNKQSKPDSLRIGLISGLTGKYAAVGENWKNGATLAYEAYKKQNPNISVNLFVENDAFNPEKGLSAYKKLMDVDKINALMSLTSPTINAIYSLVTKVDMPVIQVGEQGQAPSNDNIFQIMPGNTITEEKLGEYVKNLNMPNTIVVYNNSPVFIKFFEAFKKGYGGEISAYKLNTNTEDYRTPVTKMLKENPSAVVFITVPETGARVIQEISKLSNKKIYFAFDADFQSGYSTYKNILGNLSILDGDAVMTIITKSNEQFKAQYKKRFGEDPGFASDWGYDAFNLLVKTYNSNGKKWIQNVKNANFEGVSGLVKFNEVGVRAPEFEVKIIKNGEL